MPIAGVVASFKTENAADKGESLMRIISPAIKTGLFRASNGDLGEYENNRLSNLPSL